MSYVMEAPPPVSTQGRPIATDLQAAGELNYLTNGGTIRSWLLTGDHKRIAVLYIVTTTIAFLLGALAAALVRLELITPEGDLMSSETYNRMFTAHGVI